MKIINYFVVMTLFLSGCSAMMAMKEVEAIQKEGPINTAAFYQARAELHSMCNSGDTFCAPRLVKMGNGIETEDWQYEQLPSYSTIIFVHEKVLRASRGSLRFYEETMLALSRALAKKADNGEITPEQLKLAFNEGWKWMIGQVRNDYALLQQNVVLAQQADAKVWETVGNVVVGLAVVATAVIVADAEIRAANYQAYQASRPLNCYANRAGNNIYVQCQ